MTIFFLTQDSNLRLKFQLGTLALCKHQYFSLSLSSTSRKLYESKKNFYLCAEAICVEKTKNTKENRLFKEFFGF